MKKLLFTLLAVGAAVPARAADFDLNSVKASALAASPAPVPAPSAPAKEDPQVPQDLVNRFTQLKNDLWRFDSDTTWLRSDMDRLESDARRIEMGASNAFFSMDLRRMSSDMSRRSADARNYATELKNLLNLAVKDQRLNQLASDIAYSARNLDSRFQFDVQNAAQNLESTVRRIDPKLIGYDAQWTASDLSRNCRDIQWQTRDLRWDSQELQRRTQP